MSKKIIFSAGGTGGHIIPAINLMEHFFNKDNEVLIITDYRGNKFLKGDFKFKSKILKSGTPTNKNILHKFFTFFIILKSIIISILILIKEKPNLVFGFGGYASFPICIASKFLKIPLVIYENNIIFGKANKILSHFSDKILVANKIEQNLSEKLIKKISIVGPIINKKIINKKNLKIEEKSDNFSILVLGGSQGAEIFGKVVPEVIKMLQEKGYNVKINQQCLLNQKSQIIDFYKKNNVKNYVFDFEENILHLILDSDIAITRSGASSTAELAHTLTPFIAVPLANSIDNHQYLNAKYYKDKGCCWILEEKDFNISNLFNFIVKTINEKNQLKNICHNMTTFHRNDAYTYIEKEIKNFI